MANGISGSNSTGDTINGIPAQTYMTLELRVLSNLISNLLGPNSGELLGFQRQDQAFELGVYLPPDVNG